MPQPRAFVALLVLPAVVLAALLAMLLASCAAPVSPPPVLPGGLGLARLRDDVWFRVSSTDPTGGNADYRPIPPGDELVLADIEGPAVITHIWCTFGPKEVRDFLILRVWWDGESEPSIVAPLGPFVGAGHHDVRIPYFSNAHFDVSPQLGLNCHLPMPFRKHARLTVTNNSPSRVGSFYYYVDGERVKSLPDDVAYLHASYRIETPCAAGRDYVFAEGRGRGHLLGVNLAVETTADGWWGEGDDKITIDGTPVMQGTGTEDYFCGAWNFGLEHAGLYQGSPRLEAEKKGQRHCVYRFHTLDPISFRESFRYAIEHGHANDRADNWSSVAFWYQTEPHAPFPEPWRGPAR